MRCRVKGHEGNDARSPINPALSLLATRYRYEDISIKVVGKPARLKVDLLSQLVYEVLDSSPPPPYRRRTMKTSIITAALILCLTAASAWSQTRTKLNVIYPAISGINAPLWYATEQKLFPKYGLDVELIYISHRASGDQSRAYRRLPD